MVEVKNKEVIREEIEAKWGKAKPKFLVLDFLAGMNETAQYAYNIRINNVAGAFNDWTNKKIRMMEYKDWQELSDAFNTLYNIPNNTDFLVKK